MDDQGAGQAYALAHAAGHFLGVGVFVAAEADEVDGFFGAFVAFGAGDALGFEAELDVFLDGEPGEEGEALEHHGDTFGGAAELGAAPDHVAGGGLQEAGYDAEEGGFAGAGAAEEAYYFIGFDCYVHVVQDHEVAGGVLVVGLLAVADF